jgi:glycosyltransferase involved in cell wall biosynthesis
VLHVNDNPPGDGFGGAEVFLARLVAAQRERGDEVDVLTGDGSHVGARAVLDLWDRRSHQRLRERVRVFRPDVVHVHNVVRQLSPAVLRPTGVRTVMTFHDLRSFGGSEHRLPDPRAAADLLVLNPLVRRLASATTVVGVSETVAAVLRSAGLDATAVPVPVPAPTATPQPVEECHDVLFAGKLSADKGVLVLVEAFERLNHPTARLVLAGDGPLQVAGVGRLTQHQVSEAMGRSRVVVVPSLPSLRREGSSLTAVEGARHGRPVVGSDDPAVAEVMGVLGGDVVPAGDVAALAARLDHWLSHPAEAAAAGAASRERSEAFDPARVAEAYAEIYSAGARKADRRGAARE